MLKLSIDGISVQVPEGTTILDAAKKAGVYIPTLCYLREVNAIGSCRVCCVEVEGRSNLVPACNTPVQADMKVATQTDLVKSHRRTILGLLLADHGLDTTNHCFSCAKNGSCELQAVCRECEVEEPLFPVREKREPIVEDNPFLRYDPNLCIRCQRCVGACNRIAGNHTLQAGRKGVRTAILAPFGSNWKTTDCESCGNCAAACPTGALVEKRRVQYREWEVERVLTTCPHCAVGCQYYLVVKDGKIVDTESAGGPSNRWRLCVKGRSASFDFVHSPDRIDAPLVKNKETGEFEKVTWDEAINLVAERLSSIAEEHGSDSLAFFACSRSTNEDIYLFQKMARAAFKTNNVDNCARV